MASSYASINHIHGSDRSEVLLFPEAIDDYITPENPVRFIDALIDQLDLAAQDFKHAVPKDTGRPPYDPRDLLRLYLYGYLHRVRASRKLEPEPGAGHRDHQHHQRTQCAGGHGD